MGAHDAAELPVLTAHVGVVAFGLIDDRARYVPQPQLPDSAINAAVGTVGKGVHAGAHAAVRVVGLEFCVFLGGPLYSCPEPATAIYWLRQAFR